MESKRDIIKRLKQEMLSKQGYKPAQNNAVSIVGIPEIEAAFPNGVFPTGMIHELICTTGEEAAACGGFLAGLLAALMTSHSIAL